MKRRISLLLAALLLAAAASASRNPVEIAGYILDGRIVTAKEFEAADTEPAIMYKTREAAGAPCVLVAASRSGAAQPHCSYTWIENVNINGVKALQGGNIGRIRKDLIGTVRLVPADKAAKQFGDDARDGAIVVTLRKMEQDDPARPRKIDDIFYPRAEGKTLTGVPTRITDNRASADKKPLIVLRHDGKEYTTASLNDVDHNAIRSVSVLKDATARNLFEKYGDTSDGVIIVELRENAQVPADARTVRVPSKPETAESADAGGQLLLLVMDERGEPRAVKTLGGAIKAEDVESMTIIKNDDARRYDSYGDTSIGVCLIKFKAGRVPKRFR